MPYLIQRLDFFTIKEGNYLLDANIWLKILRPKTTPTTKDKKYNDFFDSLRKTKNTNIVVPVLVLSEVINRYLREVSMQKFLDKNNVKNPTPDYYKTIFRPSPDFKKAYDLLCDEINTYQNSFTLISDGIGSGFGIEHILDSPPKGLDFNDYLYYILCKKQNYTLVTDDKDFFVEDVQVITLNTTLLDLHYTNLSKK